MNYKGIDISKWNSTVDFQVVDLKTLCLKLNIYKKVNN